MSQSAYLTFMDGSSVPSVTLEELKEQLTHYRDQLSRTAEQLDWAYAEAAFPYSLESKPEGEGKWFYLKGTAPLYNHMLLGVGSREEDGVERHYVQVVLPDQATPGDKAKANEFCKYLGAKWKARLRLFNGRSMNYDLGKVK